MTLLSIDWNVSSEIFTIFDFPIRWYGVLFASGFLIGQFILAHIYRKEGIPESDLDSLMLYMVLSTVIGARVGHYLFYEYQQLFQDPFAWFLSMITPPFSGLASHGATVGILTGLWLYAKSKKQNFFWVVDRVVIAVAMSGCLIRLGNLMNSEIVGKPTDVAWAFNFLKNTEYYPIVPRHPSQLYEAISCFVLCILLFIIWNKYKQNTPHGLLLGIFLIWIFGLRFFYEFLKENQEAFENTMTYNMGQLLSIPAVMLGMICLWFASKKKTGAYVNENN